MEKAMGINIFSGEKGLGGALTNPTEIAYRKRSIVNQYPVVVRGVNFISAEAAYQNMKIPGDTAFNDMLMVKIIHIKLKTHPRLFNEIKRLGGRSFLESCTHYTYAKTASAKSWEGSGMDSRFIRNLVGAYEMLEAGIENDYENAPQV